MNHPAADTSAMERETDQQVYALYGLTPKGNRHRGGHRPMKLPLINEAEVLRAKIVDYPLDPNHRFGGQVLHRNISVGGYLEQA